MIINNEDYISPYNYNMYVRKLMIEKLKDYPMSVDKKPKVLLIEDHDTIILTVLSMEASRNIDITVCKSLEHVLNCNIGLCDDIGFYIENFDYILVDYLTFGRINGIEFIETIPKNQRHKCIPFSTDDECNMEMICLGADSTVYGKGNIKSILKYIIRDWRRDYE